MKSFHVVIDFDGGRMIAAQPVAVPQTVRIARVTGTLAEVSQALAALPARAAGHPPYPAAVVTLDKPEPRLRTAIEGALDGKHARLVSLRVEMTADGAALADRVSARRLAELDPRDVFARLWARDHVEPPGEAVVAGFERLLREVER